MSAYHNALMEEGNRDDLRKALRKAWDELEICRGSYDAMTKGWLATCVERDAANALLRDCAAYCRALKDHGAYANEKLRARIAKHLGD
jgi:hypothetical protein